ncbi:TPA: DUF202 domain-containing protein [Klebsiella aerogenes]
MPGKRFLSPQVDPGLQPERTALAWCRTCLGFSAMLLLVLRHFSRHTGGLFQVSSVLLMVAVVGLYQSARRRGRMSLSEPDFCHRQTLCVKGGVVLALCCLAWSLALRHAVSMVVLLTEAI